jgi:transcriptional/translational regulatory protein YebC/TACO1
MLIKKNTDPDAQELALIDAGAEDIVDIGDSFEVYTAPTALGQVHKKLKDQGFEITESELQMKPVNFQTVTDPSVASKAIKFIEDMEDLEDVQNVFSNLDIPDDVMNTITS